MKSEKINCCDKLNIDNPDCDCSIHTNKLYDDEENNEENNEEGYQDIIERIRLERERKKREASYYKDLYTIDYKYVSGFSKKRTYESLENSNKKQRYDYDIYDFLVEV